MKKTFAAFVAVATLMNLLRVVLRLPMIQGRLHSPISMEMATSIFF